MAKDKLEKQSEQNGLVEIASIMHGSKRDEFVFQRAQNALCDLIQNKYGESKGVVQGLLDYPLTGERKQTTTLWGDSYAGNLEIAMPPFFNPADRLKLKGTQVSYNFKGALQGKSYTENGGIFFTAEKDYIYDFIEGISSELRREVSKTNPYLCLMLNKESISSDKETKIIPGNRAYLVKEDMSILEMDAEKVAKTILDLSVLKEA